MNQLAIALCTMAAVSVPANFTHAADLRPKGVDAVPLSSAELRGIYAGNTWLWDNGGAFFGHRGEFQAVSRQQSGQVDVGVGTWTVAAPGTVCFEAEWRFNGTTDVRRCFAHVQANGNIYQRSLPSGQWYIFKHRSPRRGDEVNKFRPGNLVTRQVSQ